MTAELQFRPQVSTTFHAAGHLDPVPCFDRGIDAGVKVTLNPEIQLFGTDLFDETFDVVKEDFTDILSGEIGCHYPPVVKLSYSTEDIPGTQEFLVHLDASGSYDPDGGPVKFRWDFDNDGLCDAATLTSPRVTFKRTCRMVELHEFCGSFISGVTVTDDENASTIKRVTVKHN